MGDGTSRNWTGACPVIGQASVQTIAARWGGREQLESLAAQGSSAHFSVLSVAAAQGSAHDP